MAPDPPASVTATTASRLTSYSAAEPPFPLSGAPLSALPTAPGGSAALAIGYHAVAGAALRQSARLAGWLAALCDRDAMHSHIGVGLL
jgi:hypothetical protein